MLILEIFASHAHTSEGKLQVEIARLRYTAPRLTGKVRGAELARQSWSLTAGTSDAG
jgi:GTP-binding protein HflX